MAARHRECSRIRLFIVAVLVPFVVCYVSEVNGHGSRLVGEPSSAADRRSTAASGQRQSSIRRWMERIMPHRLHGSFHFGRGRSARLETEFGMDLDSSGKWWLGDNVCVTSVEEDGDRQLTTRRGRSSDSVDDSDNDGDEENTEGHEALNVRFDDRRRSGSRVQWSWSAGGTTEERSTSHRAAYSRTCVEVTNPTPQYRCTTENRVGRKATVTTTVYECCPGYRRAPASNDGCNIEIRPDILTTLKTKGISELAEALNVSGLADLLRNDDEGNSQFTVFAPPDVAFNTSELFNTVDLDIVRVSQEHVAQTVDRFNDIMADHVTQGRVLSGDFVDNMMLPSALIPETRHVRINKYFITRRQRPLLTANCVPMESVDNIASNGVIHTVKRLLPPVVYSIDELIGIHPQLTVLGTLMSRLKMNLTVERGYTLLAPSDAAFERLDPSLMQRLMNADDKCAINLLRQHIIPQVVCSTAMKLSSVSSTNFQLNLVNIDRRQIGVTVGLDDDEMYADGQAQFLENDLMATNGVIHIINGVLFNKSLSSLLNFAKSPAVNAGLFIDLIHLVGMQHLIESMNDNFTLFLPTNDAMQEVADVIENMTTYELKQLVEYHLIPQALSAKDLYNDRLLTTLYNSSLLIKEYHSFPFSRRTRKTVQCALIVQSDINSNGICPRGTGHVVNSVLRRPQTSLLNVLLNDAQFSRLYELFQQAELIHLLENQDAVHTLVAPNNTAFEQLPAATLRKLTSDVNVIRRVLLSHIIPDVLCCSGVFPSQRLQLPVNELNLDGWLMQVSRDSVRQAVTIEQVPVRRCDLTANNGVVHVVDRFIPSAIDRHVSGESRSRFSSFSSSMYESIVDTVDGILRSLGDI